MKKVLLVLPLLCALVFVGCDDGEREIKKDPTAKTAVVPNVVTERFTRDDLKGRPSVVLFGGTYCSHCEKALPIFKETIWDAHKNDANVWVNVIDHKKFDIDDIAQGFNPNFTFDELARKECRYVPSWVVLDAGANPVLSSCGGERSIEDMKRALESLL